MKNQIIKYYRMEFAFDSTFPSTTQLCTLMNKIFLYLNLHKNIMQYLRGQMQIYFSYLAMRKIPVISKW